METPLTPLIYQRWFNVLTTTGLIAIYSLFLLGHVRAVLQGGPVSFYVFVAMETVLIVLLLLRHRAQVRTDDPIAWFIAFAGSFLPLLFIPVGNPISASAGEALLIVGGLLAVASYLSLNRSFGVSPALRHVKTTGLYCLIRHPMYFSYLVMYVGYQLLSFSILNVTLLVTIMACLILRIHFEERLLKNSGEYQAYMEHTKWRLLPGVF